MRKMIGADILDRSKLVADGAVLRLVRDAVGDGHHWVHGNIVSGMRMNAQ
jgi:hypothetical protein